MKTFSIKKEDIKKKWLLIDARNAVLGRLAVISANILRGKNKPEYTPNQDCGDNLIIINSDLVQLKGKKADNKIYYRHTGFPGGIKETTPNKMKDKNKSDDIIKLAIKRMITNLTTKSARKKSFQREKSEHPPKPTTCAAISCSI